MPIGKLTIIKDFLPPPEELVFHAPTVKITISLDKSSVDFFKKQAKKRHTAYQKMIGSVVTQYVQSQQRA